MFFRRNAGKEVPEVDIASGEDAAHEALATFTGKSRLKQFASGRNDPVNLEARPSFLVCLTRKLCSACGCLRTNSPVNLEVL